MASPLSRLVAWIIYIHAERAASQDDVFICPIDDDEIHVIMSGDIYKCHQVSDQTQQYSSVGEYCSPW